MFFPVQSQTGIHVDQSLALYNFIDWVSKLNYITNIILKSLQEKNEKANV